MPHVCFDENNFAFPPVNVADQEGLVLVGGQVTKERVIEAYTKGIFPWYNDDKLPLWWSPDPRFVLFPDDLHVSRSMKKILARNEFYFRTNTAFEEVIHECAKIERQGQRETWITAKMKEVYTVLFYEGYAHSAEAWKDDKLVGGMYGLRIGNVFFAKACSAKKAMHPSLRSSNAFANCNKKALLCLIARFTQVTSLHLAQNQ